MCWLDHGEVCCVVVIVPLGAKRKAKGEKVVEGNLCPSEYSLASRTLTWFPIRFMGLV